ncbi:MAG: YeeE/YedE family protein [Bacteroidota bacterium]|nr:YeeE/YedE family protein [Bacteroidota bacterium]
MNVKDEILTEKFSIEENTDFEVKSLDSICVNELELQHKRWHNIKYLIAGILFGIILVKAEVISWFRIQEMFRFESFHMYGIIGTAVIIGIISIQIIKRFNVKTIYGEKIEFHKKKFSKGQVIGGLIFGFGWAITGACPGPMFALIGGGFTVVILTLLSAIAGTWFYGYVRERLPH